MGLLAKAAFNNIRAGGRVSPPELLRPVKRPGLLLQGLKKRDSFSPVTALQREIQKMYGNRSSMQGIVLEGSRLPEFSARVNSMVSALGAATALPSRRCLVLFSNSVDRELLAHRLSKSLNTEVLAVFTADVQAVSKLIRPYL
ncbi:hypothetical protein FACS189485_23440 [Spirochaetia bacterium]|nr:hypothetical protein FACS189485_23440 [Spirochaetia bacterium]